MVGSSVSRRTRVTAITVSTNERAWLSACIGSLTKSKLADRLELEVVLVDNASTDGSADYVEQQFSSVRVLRNPENLRFAGANNVGIADALARGNEHVLLVNPDTITPPDLILRLVQFMAEWPEYGIVGPLQYTYPADGSPSSELNAWSLSALEAGERHAFYLDWPDHAPAETSLGRRAPNTLEHSYVQGSALLCRAEVFRDIGLFDTAYHTYYEEVDLCRRARYAHRCPALSPGAVHQRSAPSAWCPRGLPRREQGTLGGA
jgi:GT2 family glycosyltransferase